MHSLSLNMSNDVDVEHPSPFRCSVLVSRNSRKGNWSTEYYTHADCRVLAHWCHLHSARYIASWFLGYGVESILSRIEFEPELSIHLFVAMDFLVCTSQAPYIYKTIWHRGFLFQWVYLPSRSPGNHGTIGTPVIPINIAAQQLTTITAALIILSILFCLPVQHLHPCNACSHVRSGDIIGKQGTSSHFWSKVDCPIVTFPFQRKWIQSRRQGKNSK
jgi:hypothetical protein